MERLDISKNVPHSLFYTHTLSKSLCLLQGLQSIDPSNHRSMDSSINRLIDRSINPLVNPSIDQSINPSIHRFFFQRVTNIKPVIILRLIVEKKLGITALHFKWVPLISRFIIWGKRGLLFLFWDGLNVTRFLSW